MRGAEIGLVLRGRVLVDGQKVEDAAAVVVDDDERERRLEIAQERERVKVVQRGKAVFAKSCAACHKLDGVGQAVGPDLAGIAKTSDRAAENASPAIRARMEAAFIRSCQYEWLFWDAAWHRRGWPVSLPPSGT